MQTSTLLRRHTFLSRSAGALVAVADRFPDKLAAGLQACGRRRFLVLSCVTHPRTSMAIMNHTLRLRQFVATAFLALALGGYLNAVELPGAGALADLVMGRFDSNGDSKIDGGEWQLGAAASLEEIDVDRDGKITATEIDALGEPIGKEAGAAAGALVPKLIKPLILSMDADGDGAVSREEFTKKMDALFAGLDADKDAQLTRGELIALPVKAFVPAPK